MRSVARSRRGNYSVIVAVGILTLVGFAGLAVDGLWVQAAKAQAQFAADAGAHAGLVELRNSGDEDSAREAAETVMELNFIGSTEIEVDPATITFGGWDYEDREFSAGATYNNAIRTRVEGDLPLLLGPILGYQTAYVASNSKTTAALRPRNIIVVQDITGSFIDEMPDARDANLALLDYLAERSFPGDQVGMVTFVGGATVYDDLSPVSGNEATIRSSWEQITWCDFDLFIDETWEQELVDQFPSNGASSPAEGGNTRKKLVKAIEDVTDAHGVDSSFAYNSSYLVTTASTEVFKAADVAGATQDVWYINASIPSSPSPYYTFLPRSADHMTDCTTPAAEGLTTMFTHTGGGTFQGAGLQLGVQQLLDHADPQAVKVIVLITDGEPDAPGGSDAEARDAHLAEIGVEMADWADSENISVFVVSMNDPTGRTEAEMEEQREYCDSLTRGLGAPSAYDTENSSDLTPILLEIAKSIPIALVE